MGTELIWQLGIAWAFLSELYGDGVGAQFYFGQAPGSFPLAAFLPGSFGQFSTMHPGPSSRFYTLSATWCCFCPEDEVETCHQGADVPSCTDSDFVFPHMLPEMEAGGSCHPCCTASVPHRSPFPLVCAQHCFLTLSGFSPFLMSLVADFS